MAAAAAAVGEQHDAFGAMRNDQRSFQLNAVDRDRCEAAEMRLFGCCSIHVSLPRGSI